MNIVLNLSGWIERRKSDIGPYAEYIIKAVMAYEDEIKRLQDEYKAEEVTLMNNTTKDVTILVGGYLTVIGEYVKTLDDGRTCVRCNGQVFVGLRVK